MGDFIKTDEPEADIDVKTGVYIGHPVDWDSNPATGEVIGTTFSEKYECGDTINFDPATRTEVK